jgi:hypothetical protein
MRPHTKIGRILLTYSAAPRPGFDEGVKKRHFLRQVQDTESVKVQGQPLTLGLRLRRAQSSRLGRRQARSWGWRVERWRVERLTSILHCVREITFFPHQNPKEFDLLQDFDEI